MNSSCTHTLTPVSSSSPRLMSACAASSRLSPRLKKASASSRPSAATPSAGRLAWGQEGVHVQQGVQAAGYSAAWWGSCQLLVHAAWWQVPIAIATAGALVCCKQVTPSHRFTLLLRQASTAAGAGALFPALSVLVTPCSCLLLPDVPFASC